ncbi:MAG: M20/M25/M40 family metallo-hydrolase [Armatimonadetes bacterium]|nr:M20/M25/M40 family metallo-hydrolase [Armatimonadota bacterium]
MLTPAEGDNLLAFARALIAAPSPSPPGNERAAATLLGEAPPLGTFPGGTDAIWWQGVGGIPTVPAFGPGLLPHCHRPNESVAVAELFRAAEIYALTILSYLREE